MSEYIYTDEVEYLIKFSKENTEDTSAEFIAFPVGYLQNIEYYLGDLLSKINTPDLPKAPSFCLNEDCRSDALDCIHSTHESELVIKYYKCLECGTEWSELYRFINYKRSS